MKVAQARKPRIFLSAEERRDQVVKAAFACLEKHGYARLTARRIAEESRMSLGQITYYFDDMQAVLVAAYRHASGLLSAATERELGQPAGSALERLEAFLAAGFGSGLLRRGYLRVRIDLWSAALADPDIASVERDLYEAYRRRLEALIAQVAEERGVDKAPVEALVDTIMAALDGLWLDWQRRGEGRAVRNGLRCCVALVDKTLRR